VPGALSSLRKNASIKGEKFSEKDQECGAHVVGDLDEKPPVQRRAL
jgi:hypothetical protein